MKCVRDVRLGKIATREQKTEADNEACDAVEIMHAEIDQVDTHKNEKADQRGWYDHELSTEYTPQQKKGQVISRTDPDDRNKKSMPLQFGQSLPRRFVKKQPRRFKHICAFCGDSSEALSRLPKWAGVVVDPESTTVW